MKKIILFIALGLFFTSCDLGDEEPNYTLEILPISEVTMPTAFAKDSITEIPLKYIRPTSCHFFDDFYYEKINFQRTVAIYCAKANLDNCQNDNVTVIEVPLRFKPTELGTYHFKFWTGENSLGANQFLEYDVVVDH
ncbi:MAG: hypothetical protein V4648_02275 [Bacteroidota bacterium]